MNASDHSYIQPLLKKLQDGTLKVCSVGAGYVGSLTSIVLAAQQPNLTVQVCDVNKDLIARWTDQRYPFFEPNLADQYIVSLDFCLRLSLESRQREQ
jgi:UDP-glucose 6-dehydrogenase